MKVWTRLKWFRLVFSGWDGMTKGITTTFPRRPCAIFIHLIFIYLFICSVYTPYCFTSKADLMNTRKVVYIFFLSIAEHRLETTGECRIFSG